MIDISGHLRSFRQEYGFEDKKCYAMVNCCGYQKLITKNFTRSREAGRLDYQIIYIVQGKGFFKIDGKMIEVPEGNIVVYHPGEVQYYTYYHRNYPEVYWIHFTGYGIEEILTQSGLFDKRIYYIGLSNPCIEYFKRIMNEYQIKKPLHEQLSNAVFMELLAHMGRKALENEQSDSSKKNESFQKVLEAMHSSYNLKWSVSDFARSCNLSIYRFIHNFKALMGMAPMEYLTAIRIDHAKELLLSSSLNISEISDVVGYENPLYFSRVFKKYTGMSPNSYRKNNGA